MRIFLSMAIVSLTGALLVEAAPEGFERYKVILDRKPFGEPPIVPEPVAAPVPVTPPWAETYRLVSVTKVEGDDVRVGILDTRSNRAVVLKVGEMEDGIELLSANIEEESAELRKGGEVVTMTLTAANPGSRPNPTAAAGKAPPSSNRRTIAPRGQPTQPGAIQPGQPTSSPRGVLRNRIPPPPPR